eukprot:361455-Chlamydomonas_euryale.AAC.9
MRSPTKSLPELLYPDTSGICPVIGLWHDHACVLCMAAYQPAMTYHVYMLCVAADPRTMPTCMRAFSAAAATPTGPTAASSSSNIAAPEASAAGPTPWRHRGIGILATAAVADAATILTEGCCEGWCRAPTVLMTASSRRLKSPEPLLQLQLKLVVSGSRDRSRVGVCIWRGKAHGWGRCGRLLGPCSVQTSGSTSQIGDEYLLKGWRRTLTGTS